MISTLLAVALTALPPAADALPGMWMMCDRGLQYTEDTDPRGAPNLRVWLDRDGSMRLGWPEPRDNPPVGERSGTYTYADGYLTLAVGREPLRFKLRADEAGTLVATSDTGIETRLCPLDDDAAGLDRPILAYSLTAVITKEGELENRLDPWSPPPAPPAGDYGVWEVVRIVAKDGEMPPYGYPTRVIAYREGEFCRVTPDMSEIDPERCGPLENFTTDGKTLTRGPHGELVLGGERGATYFRWVGPLDAPLPKVRQRVVLLETR